MNVIHLSQAGAKSKSGTSMMSIPIASAGVMLFSKLVCSLKKLWYDMSRRMMVRFESSYAFESVAELAVEPFV